MSSFLNVSGKCFKVCVDIPKTFFQLIFFTQIMIIYCILEIDEHEHERLILRFKPQPFFLLFKEIQRHLSYSK